MQRHDASGVPGSSPHGAPQNTSLVLQMVFWVRGVCLPEHLAVGVSTPLPLLLLIMIEDETSCLRSDVAYCSVYIFIYLYIVVLCI